MRNQSVAASKTIATARREANTRLSCRPCLFVDLVCDRYAHTPCAPSSRDLARIMQKNTCYCHGCQRKARVLPRTLSPRAYFMSCKTTLELNFKEDEERRTPGQQDSVQYNLMGCCLCFGSKLNGAPRAAVRTPSGWLQGR